MGKKQLNARGKATPHEDTVKERMKERKQKDTRETEGENMEEGKGGRRNT